MNEYGILMHLLSKHLDIENTNGTIYGASNEELMHGLNLTGKYAHLNLYNQLTEFSQVIRPLCLQLRQNPFTQRWFLSSDLDLQNFFKSNPFQNKTRLGATLFTILSLCLSFGRPVEIQTVKKYRKKVDLDSDLQELEKMKFITKEGLLVGIHPNLGNFLDFEQFLKIMQTTSIKQDIPKDKSEILEE
ncbi:MAG: hypothetical protein ACTSVU_08475 [Promethearchaeota archaeon]